MTKLLDQALMAARELPSETQDEIAGIVLMLAERDRPIVALTAEEKASLAESRQQAARGEFATDDEVRAVWAKYGL